MTRIWGLGKNRVKTKFSFKLQTAKLSEINNLGKKWENRKKMKKVASFLRSCKTTALRNLLGFVIVKTFCHGLTPVGT